MKSSYKKEDVHILLKDITGLVKPLNSLEREEFIQNGGHYSQVLPIEYKPSQEYLKMYNHALKNNSKQVAQALNVLCQKIIEKRGENVVLVSLARAGIPIGILIKRFLKFAYNIDAKHYAISIIRDKGIDKNAMKFILDRHNPEDILFVDGWTGKGAILNQLETAMKDFKGVSNQLAVLADTANLVDIYGTKQDMLIPSACLNCTVSGLVSRTFLRDDIIKENDFHGALYYENMKELDVSYQFINQVEKYFTLEKISQQENIPNTTGYDECLEICEKFGVVDINHVKPSIGETTRVLLRRVPELVLINKNYKDDEKLAHIIKLAQEKNTNIMYYDLKNYKACGIIKSLK